MYLCCSSVSSCTHVFSVISSMHWLIEERYMLVESHMANMSHVTDGKSPINRHGQCVTAWEHSIALLRNITYSENAAEGIDWQRSLVEFQRHFANWSSAGSQVQALAGIPGIPGSRDFKSAKIPGFFKLKIPGLKILILLGPGQVPQPTEVARASN